MANVNFKSREVLAKNLLALMHKNNHSEMSVHRETGLSQSTVGRVLRAESAASVDTLDKLALLYGVPSWLLLVSELNLVNLSA